MKKRILNFGLIAAAILMGINIISLLVMGDDPENFAIGEVIGYSTIILSMAVIYFAAKSYRDQDNEGKLSFGEGMKIGLGISCIGGIVFGLYNIWYLKIFDPEFMEKYFAYTSGLERGSEEFIEGLSKLEAQSGFWMSIGGQTVLMFLTVFLIGVVISIISSFILQRKESPTHLVNA
ncbi:MAG: DUF4199 domain-containing protein [Bacteroidota bacterium]